MTNILASNLLSPIPLAFALGVIARLLRSEFSLPKDLYTSLSIYLLFALGLKGGVELAHSGFETIARPAAATLLLGIVTPISAYLILRRAGGFSTSDSAGIAAHYGSVSAVTFIAATEFVGARGAIAEGFMPTLLTLLESPGIHIALAIGVVQKVRAAQQATIRTSGGALILSTSPSYGRGFESLRALTATLHEVVTGRTMMLLVGGLAVGYLMGENGWKQVSPFFGAGFKGALMLFILEMGIVAADRIEDLKKVGAFLLAFACIVPLLHGTLGVALGNWAGLSVGGCTVLGAMAASASYIAAPPAVRAQLPDANPTYYLTTSLAMTFPFNLLVGIPLYYTMAEVFAR